MAGSDNLAGILIGVGAITGAMGLLYLAGWMARVSRTVRENELRREHLLAELRATVPASSHPDLAAGRRAA